MKSTVQKGNPNLLYSNFRKVEDYSSPFDSKSHRRTPKNRKSPFSVKRDGDKEEFQICSSKNEFDELPLDEQIAEMLKPIADTAEAIHSKVELEELSNVYQRDSANFSNKPAELEVDYTSLPGYNIQTETGDRISTMKSSKDSKYNTSLPPIKGYDPFTSNKVVKHWHYHQPVKYNNVNSRDNSINASGITETQRKSSTEHRHIKDHFTSPYKNMRVRTNLKPLNSLEFNPHSRSERKAESHDFPMISQSAKNSRTNQIGTAYKENLAESLQHFTKNSQTSELLGEMNNPVSTEVMMSSKKVNRLQNASNEANHLLQGSLDDEKLNKLSKNLLEVNQAKSQRLLADTHKRQLEISNMNEEDFTNMRESKFETSHAIMNRDLEEIKKLSPRLNFKSPEKTKKAEYYNKWYMPVESWSVSKDTNTISKKYEQLKKDINFYYHNIHDYNSQSRVDPVKDRGQKGLHQVNYETLQEKMKQNITIRKYKKQLAENHIRVPVFLRSIDE